MKQRLLGRPRMGPVAVYRGRPEWLQIQACNVPKTTTLLLVNQRENAMYIPIQGK
ncbi:MAG: hypothetical protein LV473_16795 [Nitrospira sp.]|nr:hypothetical protein [Nitrospira sp.]